MPRFGIGWPIWLMILLALSIIAVVLRGEIGDEISSWKRFSKRDVVKLLQGGLAPSRVAAQARQHGVRFELTPETERELRKAGADGALLDTLGELAAARMAGLHNDYGERIR